MESKLAKLVVVVGIALAIYVGGWLMFLEPLINFSIALDNGTLTSSMIVFTILKCFILAPLTSTLIMKFIIIVEMWIYEK